MILKALRKRFKRWWNGPANVSPMDVYPYMFEPQLHQLVDFGKTCNLSMELLDTYIEFRNDGYEPVDAKVEALLKWDLL